MRILQTPIPDVTGMKQQMNIFGVTAIIYYVFSALAYPPLVEDKEKNEPVVKKFTNSDPQGLILYAKDKKTMQEGLATLGPSCAIEGNVFYYAGTYSHSGIQAHVKNTGTAVGYILRERAYATFNKIKIAYAKERLKYDIATKGQFAMASTKTQEWLSKLNLDRPRRKGELFTSYDEAKEKIRDSKIQAKGFFVLLIPSGYRSDLDIFFGQPTGIVNNKNSLSSIGKLLS